MEKVLYFDVMEYKERLEKTKRSMNDKGIEVLIVTDPANMNHLTGFDGWSFYVHQGLIVMLTRKSRYGSDEARTVTPQG
ncbi:MAG TPA: aminopeptidase P family N-terminal domain-containing protein [Negativicutes bacterium]|nr:aminopeptidase P family N-terminal domain-containing protein [Negativicutes bacterium]